MGHGRDVMTRMTRAFRVAAKTATYRALAAMETFGLAWFLTGHAGTAGLVAAAAEAFKTALYVGHEMAWTYATEEE
jgi:uncharacterized membrane protein